MTPRERLTDLLDLWESYAKAYDRYEVTQTPENWALAMQFLGYYQQVYDPFIEALEKSNFHFVPREPATMIHDELRAKIIADIDAELAHPILSWLSAEQQHILQGERVFWLGAADAELDIVAKSGGLTVGAVRAMSTEELRGQMLKGIDEASKHTLLIPPLGIKILKAQHVFWAAATDEELGRVLAAIPS